MTRYDGDRKSLIITGRLNVMAPLSPYQKAHITHITARHMKRNMKRNKRFSVLRLIFAAAVGGLLVSACGTFQEITDHPAALVYLKDHSTIFPDTPIVAPSFIRWIFRPTYKLKHR